MNINFFFKKITIIFFFLIILIFPRLVLCENNTDVERSLISNKNLNLAPMLKNIMPSVVRVITSYHNLHGRYFCDAFTEKKINNSFNINQNFFKQKDLFNQNKLLKTYKKYTFSNTVHNKLGSGVIIDSKNSYVITNYHVISQSDTIDVYLTNGDIYHAILIGKSKKMDLALLKLCDANNLQSINIADFKTVHVGDYAIAIGSPYNLKNSVSFGIISALRRINSELNLYDDFIQTDAAINHGNSGGPLVNTKGELIGINTSILSNTDDDGNIGIGFSIPTNTILRFVKQIEKNKEYHQGELGILATQLKEKITDELKLPVHRGILINAIEEDSAAKKSKLCPGDIITDINHISVYNMFIFRSILKNFVENDVIELRVLRDEKYIIIPITLKYHALSVQHAVKFHYKLEGVLIDVYDSATFEPNLKNYSDCSENELFTPDINGIVIKSLKKHSLASRLGLRANDIIISVNNKNVDDIDSFKEALSVHKNIIILQIMRQENKFVYIIY